MVAAEGKEVDPPPRPAPAWSRLSGSGLGEGGRERGKKLGNRLEIEILMRTGLDLSNLKIAVITGAGPGLLNENNQKAQGLCRGRQGESSLEGSGQSFPLGAHRGWRRSGLHAASLGGVGGMASPPRTCAGKQAGGG